ncbi:MAG: hypothetical protein GY839_05455 [candidate division Zixibacteria bacterium]|nr:hypothetical protein [candidate division Zixibacteria bacterium]
MSNDIIKKCTLCGESFTADDLINNHDLRLLGMLYVPDEDEKAYYFYQHEGENCGTSFAVNVDLMRKYISEAIPDKKRAQSNRCETHCVKVTDKRECEQECNYAAYRRFLFKMIEMRKTAPSL